MIKLNWKPEKPINKFIINLTPQKTSGPRPNGQAVPLSICLGTVGASIVRVSAY